MRKHDDRLIATCNAEILAKTSVVDTGVFQVTKGRICASVRDCENIRKAYLEVKKKSNKNN